MSFEPFLGQHCDSHGNCFSLDFQVTFLFLCRIFIDILKLELFVVSGV